MPGVVFRVQTSVVPESASRAATRCVYVAMPLMRCR